ncbi:Eco57I restriction-modification methylase domain-containing protein [Pedobacter sp. MR2016-24]|uniref:Eco57I restriction-modification methylase domain-containing protein n=1 Tax=Pedobacter sp. MR2016-24 TaxID=2994466 RepID=UPI0022466AB6|nr:N-6 DNA methylase [Pedobacter sp. MR2016-24]MCX2485072.1 N-6 DNA methylase [Pedobacter sp. MR2016-24]
MTENKKTGSYYTPKILSDFLIAHIATSIKTIDDLSILEPSCGDGQFILSLIEKIDLFSSYNLNVKVVDINKAELEKTYKYLQEIPSINSSSYCGDFLEYFLSQKCKFDIIIGNPPYVNKKNMNEDSIGFCESVHHLARKYSNKIVSKGNIKNIWPAFVEASVMSLNDGGILCFVLPAEILQVKYTKELRELIRCEFEKVEVFAFNELIFDGIEQDVIALIGYKKSSQKELRGVSFFQVDSLNDLKEPKFTEKYSNIHRTNLDKWTNYILSDEELNLIHNLRSGIGTIKSYCDKVEVGIVTAANDYFILSQTDVLFHKLNEIESLIKPILPKGTAVPHTLEFSTDHFNSLLENDKRVNFVNFPNKPLITLSHIEKKYIGLGKEIRDAEGKSLDQRYKMIRRKNWYNVPSIWQSDGFFIKRSDKYPKVIVNSSGTNVTDSFYRINVNSNHSIKSLAFCFYNSLTMCLAELEGRYYGGGVLELTPNEFKSLSVPYKEITDQQFKELNLLIEANAELHVILDYTDPIVLDNQPRSVVDLLRESRRKLSSRRLKSSK